MRPGSASQYDVGVMAIGGSSGAYCGGLDDYEYLCDIQVNLNCAYKMYQMDFNNWSYWK